LVMFALGRHVPEPLPPRRRATRFVATVPAALVAACRYQ
jgi:hypothetical protein